MQPWTKHDSADIACTFAGLWAGRALGTPSGWGGLQMGHVRVWIRALGRRRLLGHLWGRLLWRGRRVQLELDFRVGELV